MSLQEDIANTLTEIVRDYRRAALHALRKVPGHLDAIEVRNESGELLLDASELVALSLVVALPVMYQCACDVVLRQHDGTSASEAHDAD